MKVLMKVLLSGVVVMSMITGTTYASVPNMAFIPKPASNIPTSGAWVQGGSQLVYLLANPLMGKANNPNTGVYFKAFNLRVFLVHLRKSGGKVTSSAPRLLFNGPRGTEIGLGSLEQNWLVYIETVAYYDPGGPWTIVAYNVKTGKRLVLDTRDREGVGSLTSAPRSDGHTVVWQSYTHVGGKVVSILRSYALATGKRVVLAEGGSPGTWFYYDARVSGQWVVTEKDVLSRQRSQVMLINVRTGRIQALTPPTAANSEPTISGNIVVWKMGWRFSNGRGLVVHNILTGHQETLAIPDVESPEASAGRHVVFINRGGTPQLHVFDEHTGKSHTIAFANSNGYRIGSEVHASGQLLSYTQGLPCANPNFICPGRYVVRQSP